MLSEPVVELPKLFSLNHWWVCAQEQIQRVLTSARDRPTTEGGSLVAGRFNRTKGTIAGYGSFSGWSKYRQLNATAMLDR